MNFIKICAKCGEEKALGEFHNKKGGKYGKSSICKECQCIYAKRNRQIYKEKIKSHAKQYYQSHKREKQQYHQNNKERENIRSKQYHQKNKKKCNIISKQYHHTHKGKCNMASRQYHQCHREKCNTNSRKYYQTHKEEYKTRYRQYYHTAHGRFVINRAKAERKRDLKYNELNIWFKGSVGHHMNRNDVIYIPVELHRSISHSRFDQMKMNRINKAAINWLMAQTE